ncbi:MAG: RNA 2',3'-cyclic phosphodiesterase [Candidatus Pacearchaeota archaeon]|nr:RNA 2',3'-cyclic phosphodiesterase [Candidatus Pacearchaeota archaeon]
MRCFLAIDLPEEVKEELLRIEREIQPFLVGNFVESKNMHLTLKFLGEIDEAKLKDIRKKLKKIKLKKFKAGLGKFGFFSPSFIRVVWISVEPKEIIKGLYEEIEKALGNKPAGFESHVALVRVKKIDDKRSFLSKTLRIKIKTKGFEVKEFVLKKSTLTPNGPIYEDLEEFELN